jgi:hypothetical protein
VFLPLSLQAWVTDVGGVNLSGSHPDWLKPGYLFDNQTAERGIWYTDPLVVEVTEDVVGNEYQNWQWRCEDNGPEKVGPFYVPVAPDEIQKAQAGRVNSTSYELPTTSPVVDAILLNERHCLSFVAYLRLAFEWGGFPGFDALPIGERPLTYLTELRRALDDF